MIKKLLYIFALLPCFTTDIFAEVHHQSNADFCCLNLIECSDTDCRCWDAKLSVGPHFNYTHLDFDEPKAIDGYMAGISVYSELRCKCMRFFLDFEGSWDTNELRGNPCQESIVAEYFLALKLMPYTFQLGNCLNVGLYTGFGWDQFTNTQLPELASLQYRYEKLFIPVGFSCCFATSNANIALEFEWRPDVYSCLNVNSTDLDNSCENGYRISMPMCFRPFHSCLNISLSVVPFFDWSRYGEAEEVNSLDVKIDIPSATRWNLGLRTLIEMNF